MEPPVNVFVGKMGRLHARGYAIGMASGGNNIYIQKLRKDGRYLKSAIVLPIDPADMRRVVAALLAVTHGPLSAQALLVNLDHTEGGTK